MLLGRATPLKRFTGPFKTTTRFAISVDRQFLYEIRRTRTVRLSVCLAAGAVTFGSCKLAQLMWTHVEDVLHPKRCGSKLGEFLWNVVHDVAWQPIKLIDAECKSKVVPALRKSVGAAMRFVRWDDTANGFEQAPVVIREVQALMGMDGKIMGHFRKFLFVDDEVSKQNDSLMAENLVQKQELDATSIRMRALEQQNEALNQKEREQASKVCALEAEVSELTAREFAEATGASLLIACSFAFPVAAFGAYCMHRRLHRVAIRQLRTLKRAHKNQNAEIAQLHGLAAQQGVEVKQLQQAAETSSSELSSLRKTLAQRDEQLRHLAAELDKEKDAVEKQTSELSRLHDLNVNSERESNYLIKERDSKIAQLRSLVAQQGDEVKQLQQAALTRRNEQFRHLVAERDKANETVRELQLQLEKANGRRSIWKADGRWNILKDVAFVYCMLCTIFGSVLILATFGKV